VEHTQMHPALKFFFVTLASLVEFFMISLLHDTKIPTMDMKVQVYSNFSYKKISKKIKSPSSMRNGRFNTSKCRGKFQKPWPIPHTSKKKILKYKNFKKKWDNLDGKWLEVGDMIIFQIRIRYHCQISRCRITR
jgi:hypothetical protein